MTVRILEGDCRDVLKTLPANSVHCCVTSPPYLGLRSYSTEPQVWGGDPEHAHEFGIEHVRQELRRGINLAASTASTRGGAKKIAEVGWKDYEHGTCSCGAWRGDLGLEPTPDLYVQHMVDVFREVRRVLRPDGTLWLNIGDSYNNRAVSRPSSHQAGLGFHNESIDTSWRDHAANGRARMSIADGDLKEKDLIGIPWMLAFALRADGWYLRADIIWSKPNPMPESVQDRPTKAHEYVFMLSKAARYFYDTDAIREDGAEPNRQRLDRIGGANGHTVRHSPGALIGTSQTRNKRSVWEIATEPFPEAHFATYPTALVEPCIKAGTSERGCCPECGAPWVRVTERASAPRIQTRRQQHLTAEQVTRTGGMRNGGTNSTTFGLAAHEMPSVITTGWRPTCKHYDDLYRRDFPQARNVRKRGQRAISGDWWKRTRRKPGKDNWPTCPATVLDCFGGAGTTGLVADRLGRDAILIELNPEYAEMARKRIQGDSPLFTEVVA